MRSDTGLNSPRSPQDTSAISSDVQDYRVAQKTVHWLMAILIIMDLFIAQKFGGPMAEWDRFESRVDHASVNMIVTVLFVVRIMLRWKYGAPPLPSTMPRWQRFSAHIGHWGLYVLIAVLILSGIMSAVNANSEIAPFGLFPLSDGSGPDQSFVFFRSIHEFCTKAIIALIVVHVLAAIYHLFFTNDRTTQNMLRFWSSAK